MQEVAKMRMASRYKPERIPNDSPITSGRIRNPDLVGKNEPEYNREQLLMKLGVLQNDLVNIAEGVRSVVMEIEASKAED